MKKTRVLIAALFALALAVTFAACTKGSVLKSANKPAPTIAFSHRKHSGMKVPCQACHRGVETSHRLGTARGPKKSDCGKCHDQVSQKEHCSMCHLGPKPPGKLVSAPPTPNLLFSHQRHMGRAKTCSTCHAAVMRGDTLADLPRPKMKDCFGCHNHLKQYRTLSCDRCHQSLAQFPLRFVSAFNHEGNFLAEHGRWARSQADVCQRCHQQSYCGDCHSQRTPLRPSVRWPERSSRRFIHRGDWISRHPVEATATPGRCTRCHSAKQCQGCHRSRGVAPGPDLPGGSAARSPHPAGWTSPASPNNHASLARRRITHCASCHDRGPQTNCIRCHSSVARGGLGLNPHPPGFDRGSKSQKVCRLCH